MGVIFHRFNHKCTKTEDVLASDSGEDDRNTKPRKEGMEYAQESKTFQNTDIGVSRLKADVLLLPRVELRRGMKRHEMKSFYQCVAIWKIIGTQVTEINHK